MRFFDIFKRQNDKEILLEKSKKCRKTRKKSSHIDIRVDDKFIAKFNEVNQKVSEGKMSKSELFFFIFNNFLETYFQNDPGKINFFAPKVSQQKFQITLTFTKAERDFLLEKYGSPNFKLLIKEALNQKIYHNYLGFKDYDEFKNLAKDIKTLGYLINQYIKETVTKQINLDNEIKNLELSIKLFAKQHINTIRKVAKYQKQMKISNTTKN